MSMVTVAEIEKMVFGLPKSERSILACRLLDSLNESAQPSQEDNGLDEAIRRSEEMDRDPSACISHDELLKALGRTA